MVREKLILICQSGGDFVSNDDGTLMYNGGEANAVNITHETEYDDLRLMLAEVCNFELSSMSMKYFLPGNRKHLITLRSGKDLKRLMEFHVSSVTVDIFVSGNQGFDRGSWEISATREGSVKSEETVRLLTSPEAQTLTGVNGTAKMAGDSNAGLCTNQAHIFAPDNLPVVTQTITTSTPSSDGANDEKDETPCVAVQLDTPVDDPTGFGNGVTPADTVKNRRRTASYTIGPNGPTIVPVADKSVDKKLQKKNDHHVDYSVNPVIDDMELVDVPWVDSLETPYGYAISYEDWPDAVTESWKLGIVGVGQEFGNVKEFREVLQKYAIAHRFIYKLKKNDTVRASGRCVSEGCSWMIDASYISASDSFQIKKFNPSHTCKGDALKTVSSRKKRLLNVMKDKLQDEPNKKRKDMPKEILRDSGIKLSQQAWRGVEGDREKVQGSYEGSYNQLPSLCEKIMEKNPGSIAKIITGDDKRFKSLFVSFHAVAQGFRRSCRPLIFLESTPLKSVYQEILFTANALDADDGFLPIAFAVVDIENEDNWRWFLDQLKSSLSVSQAITFVSDREKDLRHTVLEVFDNAYHGYSIFHLLENFKRILKGPFNGDRGLLPGYFMDAAHTLRLTSFKNFTEKIRQISSEGYDWVIQCEPEYWTSLLFQGERYNYITENVVESFIELMDDTIDQSIVCKLEAMINMICEMVSTRHKESSAWTSMLTPSKERKIQEEAFEACRLKVLCSSSFLFEVHDDFTHVVNIENQECTCLEWKNRSMPCRHAIAAFSYKGMSFYDCCSPYYSVESYRSTYSELINHLPLSDELKGGEDDDSGAADVLPPFNSKLTAKQKKELLKTDVWNKRTVTCTQCKEPGHNKASCKAVLL